MSGPGAPLEARIAGAPISWGVCEVPGWGHQMDVGRVLTEMREVGLSATEFGPDGFLPDDPRGKAVTLAGHGLAAVGGFVPVVLHDREHDPLPEADAALDGFVAAGAGVMVLAAATGLDGYDTRPELDGAGWATLFGNLDRLAERAAGRGVCACLHPHVGTMIETRDDVDRLLHGTQIPLCLDTGHLLVGGSDPVALAREVPDRIVHTHLKDVDAGLAQRVRAGELSYTDAVRAGMYRPLGKGDAGIAQIVQTLEAHGYQGWYVLEQDTVLDGEPPQAPGAGPVEDVAASVAFLRSLA
ncbi:MAG TPA: sugar phosphate isomerase/epimerase [Actinocrinis sp.]